MLSYYDYQQRLHDETFYAWQQGQRNVLAVSPTGSGKTVLFSGVTRASNTPTVIQAHRQELVSQMSLTLARNGLAHRILAPRAVVKWCCALHVRKLGKSFYDPKSRIVCAGVDTLLARSKAVEPWANEIGLVVTDEAHHVLRGNKWGKACGLFPNAYNFGVTASPERADGAGLGAHADGIYDAMIVGPTMGDLILQGRLSPFKIYAPPSQLDFSRLAVSDSTGDYKQKGLSSATRDARIWGDVIEHYLRLAPGLPGITYMPDVETSELTAEAFKRAGVPAAAISAKTPDRERQNMVDALGNGQLKQLVNVDIFGEGFDLPAIVVCSFARKTTSYSLFTQQFGRPLRVAPELGKTHAILIDHVGNVEYHAARRGLPTQQINWTLDRVDKAKRRERDPDVIPLKVCPGCTQPYEVFHAVCPYCDHKPVPRERRTPEQVEGDLTLLDLSALDELHAAIAKASESPLSVYQRVRYAAGGGAAMKASRLQEAKLRARKELTEVIAAWAGAEKAKGMSEPQRHRLFYTLFGCDVLTAQTLGTAETEKLKERVNAKL